MPGETQPLGEPDEIRLSRRLVAVPPEKRRELADRLDKAGLIEAADALRSRRTFEAEDKPRVLLLLNEWLDQVKVDEFGTELMDLRHELDYDISQGR